MVMIEQKTKGDSHQSWDVKYDHVNYKEILTMVPYNKIHGRESKQVRETCFAGETAMVVRLVEL